MEIEPGRTVCAGGTEECPPVVVTSILTSKYPFSAIEEIAKVVPNFSSKPSTVCHAPM